MASLYLQFTHYFSLSLLGYTQLDEDIDELATQFNKQTDRLKELRTKKPEPSKYNIKYFCLPLSLQKDGISELTLSLLIFILAQVLPNDDTLDNIDMFSDTTSMFSQFTRYTQASSRVSTVSSRASR